MKSILTLILLPFAFVYDFVMRIRNYMYDTGWKPSVRFEVPVISVGNLAVGGTGKTPMIEYLVILLAPTHRVATLSRGYGRTSKGFRMVSSADTASTVGDEPLQLYYKFQQKAIVSVGEERALSIPLLLDEHPDTNVILLDDAFQHRQVRPGFSILLTDFSRPFYEDHILPAGRLREHPRGADRADLIILTKCPEQLDDKSMSAMKAQIARYTGKPVFFSGIRYARPEPLFDADQPLHENIVLVSGIANHHPLEDHVKRNYTLLHHFIYRDHHHYSIKDVQVICDYIRKQEKPVTLLTTEKDRVKLESEQWREAFHDLSVYYLPISMYFLKDGKDFDARVLEFVNRA